MKDFEESLPLRDAEVFEAVLLLSCHDLTHRGLADCPHDLLKLRPVFTAGFLKTCQQCSLVLLVRVVAVLCVLKLTAIVLKLSVSLGLLFIIVHLIFIFKIFLSSCISR